MALQVYVYHPDQTSLLVDELAELEEAMALCADLVHVDGYLRAEVWSDAGDCLYALGRGRGGTVRTYADLPAEPTPTVRAPVSGPIPTPPPLADRERPTPAAAHPADAPPPVAPERPWVLGEHPDRPERWLGL